MQSLFSHTRAFQDELRPWGSIIANHIGAAIANARAFEEVRVTGKRLEQANQRLEQELAERKAGKKNSGKANNVIAGSWTRRPKAFGNLMRNTPPRW